MDVIGHAADFNQVPKFILNELTGGSIKLVPESGSDELESLFGAEDNVVSQPGIGMSVRLRVCAVEAEIMTFDQPPEFLLVGRPPMEPPLISDEPSHPRYLGLADGERGVTTLPGKRPFRRVDPFRGVGLDQANHVRNGKILVDTE